LIYSFQWLECQLKSLQSYAHSEAHLEHLLDSLPQSLDETYERMLCNIDANSVEDARRILILICFAGRPYIVPELIDAIAVELGD
jgi:ankyrin repeat domain-containing protein 50